MDRRNPRSAYSSQKSISDSTATPTGGGGDSSPMMSPLNRHLRSGSSGIGNFRRSQNNAARAAAQRLAKVMASSADDEDSSNSDEDLDHIIPVGLSTPRRTANDRSPSPALSRYLAEQTSSVRTPAGRPSMTAKQPAMIPPIKPSPRPVITSASSDSFISNRRESTSVPSESPVINKRDKRASVDLGALNMKEPSSPRSSSTVQDEIDGLQEESENDLEKLRLAEEQCEKAEARTRQRERQGAAIRATARNSFVKRDDIVSLRMEAKIARNEAVSTTEHLQGAGSELRSLRIIAQRMMLSPEQMEEMVLKRCWLARYWKLCVQHGIHGDIAERKHEYWSFLAPIPVEVVLSAGERARDGCLSDMEEKMPFAVNDFAREGNTENMILVEKGMRELACLKVEDAVLLTMAQQRCTNIKTVLSTEGSDPVEASELSVEEREDVLFKQAWLAYFWRRVKNHGLEEDIADDRLQFWIDQSTHSPISQDSVEVERGLFELRKLGIETQLWEACRRGTEPADSSHHGSQSGSEC